MDNIKIVVKGYHTVLSVMKFRQAVWVPRQTTSKQKKAKKLMEVQATTLINHDKWPLSWKGYLHCLVYSALQPSLSAWSKEKAM